MSPRRRATRAARARNDNAPQRQRLIEACISALHLYGPSHTTVEKVVAIAKMSPGIVRFYFDSKAAMMVASLQFLATEFEEKLLQPVAQLRATPVAALERLVDLYLDPEIASPRKVSVWYAFWGEASSRQEYYDICGQKDAGFAALVQELIERLIATGGLEHLDAGGVALGLIGVLEMLWQDFAFQSEQSIDRRGARARAMAYLRSVFPGHFEGGATARALAAPGAAAHPGGVLAPWAYASEAARRIEREALFRPGAQLLGHARELEAPGTFLTADTGAERVLLVRAAAGSLHALRNACPRAPHALVLERRGRFAGDIVCPVHGARFAWDGRALERGAGARRAGGAAGAVGPAAGVSAAAGGAGDLEDLGLTERDGLLFVGRAPPGEGWPRDLVPLARPAPLELAADWKVLLEQWLEAASGPPLAQSPSWSARRYRAIAGAHALEAWSERLIEPNQWLEIRADGCSVFRAVPLGAGRCRLERLDFAVGALPAGRTSAEEAERRARQTRALRYLAMRLRPRCRRLARELAESAQQGLIDYAYASRPRSGALERWHAALLARAPALGLDRAPAAS